MNSIQPEFGLWLRNELKGKKKTQRALASTIGVDESLVSRWVCGHGLPSLPDFFALCDFLGLSGKSMKALVARFGIVESPDTSSLTSSADTEEVSLTRRTLGNQ